MIVWIMILMFKITLIAFLSISLIIFLVDFLNGDYKIKG
jgi:lipopolysaccharide export LptBFGC system permease protein LptF